MGVFKEAHSPQLSHHSRAWFKHDFEHIHTQTMNSYVHACLLYLYTGRSHCSSMRRHLVACLKLPEEFMVMTQVYQGSSWLPSLQCINVGALSPSGLATLTSTNPLSSPMAGSLAVSLEMPSKNLEVSRANLTNYHACMTNQRLYKTSLWEAE